MKWCGLFLFFTCSSFAANQSATYPKIPRFVSIPQNLKDFNALGGSTAYKLKEFQNKLYVATRGGLSISEDGGRFYQTKTTYHGLPSNEILDLAINAKTGEIAVSTHNGLGISRNGGKFFRSIDSIEAHFLNDITALAYSQTGSLLVGTASGLYITDDFGGNFRFIGERIPTCKDSGFRRKLIRNHVTDIHVSDRGDIYIGYEGANIQKSEDGGKTFQPVINTESAQKITTDLQGHFYFVNQEKEVMSSADKNNGLFGVLNLKPLTIVSSILALDSKNIFIGTQDNGTYYSYENNGLFRGNLHFGGFDFLRTEEGSFLRASSDGVSETTDMGRSYKRVDLVQSPVSGRSIGNLFIDDEDQVYIHVNKDSKSVSQLSGLSISSDGGSTFSDPKNVLCGDQYIQENIKKIIKNKKSKNFFGIADRILCFYPDLTSDQMKFQRFYQIYGVALDPEGQIYIVSPEGIHLSKNGGETFEIIFKNEIFSHDPLREITVDQSGAFYGVNSHGFFTKSKNEPTFFRNPQKFPKISDLTVTQNGIIYLGTENGIFVSKDHGKNFSMITVTENKDVSLVRAKNSGEVYFLSKPSFYGLRNNEDQFYLNGLYYLDPNFPDMLTEITEKQGLPSSFVNSVELDSHEKLWIGTELGLATEPK